MTDVKRKIKEIKDKGILQKNPNKNIDLKKREFFKKSALGLAGIGGLALLSKMPLVKPWELTNTKLSKASIETISGIIETDGTYVDTAIFGPAVDGYDWDERTAASASKLMLATIKDAGADTTVEIWDLTDPDVVGGSTLGSVTISGAATPTSVAACMGYIIVGSEDGITIIDPHDGSWAERTVGWPKTLSTSTTPALDSNDVVQVAAGFSDMPPFDPRTGGPIPTFAVKYAEDESNQASIIKDDGKVWDITGTAQLGVVGFLGHHLVHPHSDTEIRQFPISKITANQASSSGDSFLSASAYPDGFPVITAFSSSGGYAAGAGTLGLSLSTAMEQGHRANVTNYGWAAINRTYNTGHLFGDIRGAWLANSATADRSYKSNTLTENGTVTEAAVESGAELMGYSGFSGSNYLSRAADTDFEFGTGSFSMSIWMKNSGNSAGEILCGFSNSGNSIQVYIQLYSSGNLNVQVNGATATAELDYAVAQDDGVWHKYDVVNISSTERYLYVNGALVDSDTTDSGTVTDASALVYGIGARGHDGNSPATAATLSLHRLSATVPTATQIRQMYDAEKGMFVANAKCLLQSGSTDAVLDVDVDKITGKVAVTQTDSVQIWDGLVVDSEPTIATGGTTWEHTKLFGEKRIEINDANLYYTAPEEKLREVAEVVRGLGSKLPKGVDLGKAKAWCYYSQHSNIINASYNIKSVTDGGTGMHTFAFGIPFKGNAGQSGAYSVLAMAEARAAYDENVYFQSSGSDRHKVLLYNYNDGASGVDSLNFFMAVFGELENE